MDKSKWEYKKLGEVASFERGLTYSKIDESDSSTKGVLRSNNIDLDSHQLVFDEIKWLNESFEIPQSKKLAKDSIFICMSNGSKAHLGKVAFIDKDYDYAFGGFMGMIKPLNIYPKYLFYYFLSKEYRDGLEQIGKGANINNLRFAQLANFMIPNPITEVQQRIVAELDCLNEMIALKQEQLKEFDKLAQSIFYDMFGDPVTNDKGWNMNTIGDVASFYNGKAHENDIDENGEFILVNAKFVASDGIILKRTNKQLFPLYENDIVMVMSDVPNGKALARCYLIMHNNKYSLNQRICVFRDYSLNSTFLLFLLNRNKYYLRFDNGNGQTNLRKNDVLECPVILPPLALQQQFAEKIQAIEAQKELVKQSIAETQQLLDSRMDYYFN